jgi:hypothetical protein
MQCKAETTTGDACKMAALKDTEFCFAHSPLTETARDHARRRGGENSHTPHFANPEILPSQITTIEEANQVLNYVLAEVVGMDNSIARARVLLTCYEMFLKSIEIAEFERRIQLLELRQK